jgi:hypothetical protein
VVVDNRLVDFGGAGPSSTGRQAERASWLGTVCHAQSTLANSSDRVPDSELLPPDKKRGVVLPGSRVIGSKPALSKTDVSVG